MSKLLTQQEMDMLLSDAATVRAERNLNKNSQVHPFDFRLPLQLSENQFQTLQALNNLFSARLEKYILSKLEKKITLTLSGTNMLFLSEYISQAANPTAAYIFKIGDSDTNGIVDFDSGFAISAVAFLLGGRQETEVKNRRLTVLEQLVFKNLADNIISELQAAWQKYSALQFSIERFESDSENLQISIPTEVLLVTSFEVNSDNQKFNLNIVYPANLISKQLSIQKKQFKEKHNEEKHIGEFVKQQLYETSLNVTALLGTSSVTIKELLELKKGDIIRTRVPVSGEVRLIIGNKLSIKGKPGVSNGHIAVSVTSTTTENGKENKNG